MAQVVIDPEVPEDVRRALESAPSGELIPFSLPPRRVASLRNAVAQRARVRKRVSLLVSGVWVALLMALFLEVTRLSATNPDHPHPATGRIIVGICVVVVSGIILAAVWASSRRRRRPAPGLAADSQRKADLRARSVTAYHRRYIVPDRDLQGDVLSRWHRASSAAAAIRASVAVRGGLIDSIEVSAVLPYHLWEIAERLALLSWPETERQRIVAQRNLDVGDPDVSRLLNSQRRSRDLTLADIETRTRALEEFADLALQAGAAEQRRHGIEELAGLDPAYGELDARLGRSQNTLDADGHLADQLRTVTAIADEAVKRMNEAGRVLAK